MWWTALLSGPALADCTFRATPDRLSAALDAAERAYVSLDVPSFERAMTEVDFVVPCLEAAADPALSARLHRMRGLGRFAAGDKAGAELSLRAAKALEPQYVFPDDVLPKGFELRDVYEGLPTEPPPTDALPRPARGAVAWLDGTDAHRRPTNVPVLWQLQDGDSIRETRYLEPTDPTPWYPGANKDQIPWFVGAGITAVAAGATYGVAAALHQPFGPRGDVLPTEQAIQGRRTEVNALVLVSTVLAVGAAGELGWGIAKGGRE